jgi:hypothetical protein
MPEIFQKQNEENYDKLDSEFDDEFSESTNPELGTLLVERVPQAPEGFQYQTGGARGELKLNAARNQHEISVKDPFTGTDTFLSACLSPETIESYLHAMKTLHTSGHAEWYTSGEHGETFLTIFSVNNFGVSTSEIFKRPEGVGYSPVENSVDEPAFDAPAAETNIFNDELASDTEPQSEKSYLEKLNSIEISSYHKEDTKLEDEKYSASPAADIPHASTSIHASTIIEAAFAGITLESLTVPDAVSNRTEKIAQHPSEELQHDTASKIMPSERTQTRKVFEILKSMHSSQTTFTPSEHLMAEVIPSEFIHTRSTPTALNHQSVAASDMAQPEQVQDLTPISIAA